MKLTAAVIALAGMLCMTCYDTSAAEAPTDIHLTVETKEIAVEDVPADRIVTLNIYQENCPYFDSLVFAMEKDPRLSFFPEFPATDCLGIADGVRNARNPGSRNSSDPDYRVCVINSSIGDDLFVEFDSAVATVTFMLPEQLSPGDSFSVDLLRSEDLYINLGKSRGGRFMDSCFTQLNSGGIRIVRKEQPAPSGGNGGGSGQGGDAQGNGEIQNSGGDTQAGGEPQTGGDNAPQENTAAVTSAAVTEKAVSSTLQSTSTTLKSTTTESTSAETSQSTTAEIPTGAPQEPEKKKTNGLLIIGIFTIIAAAVSSLTILASKLRINKKG